MMLLGIFLFNLSCIGCNEGYFVNCLGRFIAFYFLNVSSRAHHIIVHLSKLWLAVLEWYQGHITHYLKLDMIFQSGLTKQYTKDHDQILILEKLY